MISPLGTEAVAAFSAIKDMERMAFLPAIAFAQIITFLISNDIGANDIKAVKVNIKKTLLLAGFMVSGILVVMVVKTNFFLSLFDRQGEFTYLVLQTFPYISVCVIFDLTQIILSAALRGSGNVQIVMMIRLFVVILFFVPISYLFSTIEQFSIASKILLVYGSFYIGNGIMSLLYVLMFRSEKWKSTIVENA
ncbi:hypothetical protein IPH67_00080 [bacterium]|nr:MAG: hypothetical protein IPH67_00080 [bacterium]